MLDGVSAFERGTLIAPTAVVLAVVLIGSGAPGAAGQATPQQQVIRSRTDTVRVDVAVIENKTGRPVSGLTQRDFTIKEDGVPQEIVSFLAESDTGNIAQAVGDAASERRVFLIILAVYELDAGVRPHAGAAKFLRERLRPGDLAAVMVHGRVTALTSNHELLTQVVDRAAKLPGSVWNAIWRDNRAGRERRTDADIELEKWLTPPDAPPNFLKNAAPLLLGSDEWRANPDEERWESSLGVFDLMKVAAGIEYLRRVEGERHIVLLTYFGLTPPIRFVNEGNAMRALSAEDDRRIAQRASDAGVVLNVIQVGKTGGNWSIMSSRNLAEVSGGQFTSLRTADEQFRRIDDAVRNGYVLGYVPTNPNLDGKHRRIEVSVPRKDVTVIYRRGYTAQPDLPPLNAVELLTRQRLRQALATRMYLTDLQVDAQPSRPAGGAMSQTQVEITIRPEGLHLTEADGRFEGAIDLLVVAADARWRVVGQLEQHMKLSMTPAMLETARRGGIPYTAVVPVSGPVRYVKVVIYDFAADRLGSVERAVK